MMTAIVRKDGSVAIADLRDDELDFWDAVLRYYPRSYNLIDEAMIIPDGVVASWDLMTDDDGELLDWLTEAA